MGQGDLDAGDLIASFLTDSYTVTRRAAATWVDGLAVAGSTSTLTIKGCVQPASGRDLLRLPEGRRAVETRVLFTPTQLVVGGQGSSSEADLVTIDGGTWEVQTVEAWPAAVGYWRVMLQVSQ